METAFATQLIITGKAPKTVREYKRRVRLWLEYLATRGVDVLDCQPSHIRSYQVKLLREAKDVKTINAKISAISLFYDYLVEIGLMAENPVMMGYHLPLEKHHKNYLTKKTLNKLLAYLTQTPTEIRIAYLCLIYGGLRVGEVVNLKTTNIKRYRGKVFLIVEMSNGKTRKVPIIDKEAGKAIYKYAKSKQKGKLIDVSKRQIHAYGHRFGELTNQIFICSYLRENFARMCYKKGLKPREITTIMGHQFNGLTLQMLDFKDKS